MTKKARPSQAEGEAQGSVSSAEGASGSDHLPDTDHVPATMVVGIGASAGGLAALRTFFDHVPPDSGLAFVVVVHLSSDHESHLDDLLQTHVAIPVQQVEDAMPLAPNQVYVIPPGANLGTIDSHLRLSELEDERRMRAPVDHFFRTLSKTHDGNAVGLILTGTGSDGTLGIKAIKERGGLTVVQDPGEAEYDGMPQSAVSTGLVDLVLPLAEIPEAILRYARTRPRLRVPDEEEDRETGGDGDGEDRLLHKVFAQLRARTERDFSRYKRTTLLRRIRRRMQIRQVEELDDYLEVLREEPQEVKALGDDLLITVTNFFRDPEVFAELEETVIPSLFEGKTLEDELRVWSVGCATGEEAYSLAILLLEEAGRRDDPPRIQVFATDLHEESLQTARAGFYPGDILADVDAERLGRFFHAEEGGYRVSNEVRDRVVFAPHNLLGDPPFSRCDLISCRNVMIYLRREVQREVIELFHYALAAGGHLLLGTAETVEPGPLFRTRNKKMAIHLKQDVPGPEPRLPVFPTPGRQLSHRPKDADDGPPMAYNSMHLRLIEHHAPPSLLVSPDDVVVHLSQHAGRFLVHPGGHLTASVFKLVREELRVELRASLHAVRQSGEPKTSRPTQVEFGDTTRSVVLHVHPSRESAHEGFVLVIFDEREPARLAAEGPSRDVAGDDAGEADRVRELEGELDYTQQRLQAIVEEYETGQEEMRAGNEELQSANEELRSTLEELETSKEELQSMNEELQTVNQENRHKVEELSQLSGDLQNLLAATDIATLFLDRDLRIMRFTPQLGELFNVRLTDRGRPISDLTHNLGYDDMEPDARRVLESLVPVERKVGDAEDRWFLARLRPYRTSEDRIDGVVLTFVDITELKRAEEALRQLNETLEYRVRKRTREVGRLAGRLTRAEQKERRRVAQILHDDLQQQLHGVQMKLALASVKLKGETPEEALAQITEADEWLAQGVEIIRQLSVDLSPPVLDQGSLGEALEWLSLRKKELYGLEVEIVGTTDVHLADEETRILLFHALRELLFNVVKHADTPRACIEVSMDGGTLRIEVSDQGCGFDPTTPYSTDATGLGLASLRERLGIVGGTVAVDSRPGEGTRVALSLPVRLAGKDDQAVGTMIPEESPEGGSQDDVDGSGEALG